MAGASVAVGDLLGSASLSVGDLLNSTESSVNVTAAMESLAGRDAEFLLAQLASNVTTLVLGQEAAERFAEIAPALFLDNFQSFSFQGFGGAGAGLTDWFSFFPTSGF